MAELKLGKLADRTPVKITISMAPDLHQTLTDYAALYFQAYGREEPIAELIPAMLQAFIDSDRGFLRAREKAR